jgi:heme A synthase
MNTIPAATPARPSRLFISLALTTALLTVGLIVFGAIVRVTDSGLGCGSEWPTCHGSIIPPLNNLTAWIEWGHRAFAVLIGVFGLITLIIALRSYRQVYRAALVFTVAAALLYFVQSMLGMIVVKLELPPTFVTLHLGVAMLLLGALLVAAVIPWYQPVPAARDQVTVLAYANAAFALVIMLTGALVRGSGATLACTAYPFCVGTVLLPTDMGQLALIHMFHRFAVAAFGLTLVILVWQIYRLRQNGFVRMLAAGALTAYLLQVGIGAMYVFSVAAPLWGAAHVGMAATTWALLVVLSTVEALNTGEILKSREAGVEWKSPSNTTAAPS